MGGREWRKSTLRFMDDVVYSHCKLDDEEKQKMLAERLLSNCRNFYSYLTWNCGMCAARLFTNVVKDSILVAHCEG